MNANVAHGRTDGSHEAVIDAGTFHEAMGRFVTGVAVVTSTFDGTPVGTTVAALTGVSSEPAMLLACLASSSSTNAVIASSGHFAVNAGHDLGPGRDADVTFPPVAGLWWDHVDKPGVESRFARESELYLALAKRAVNQCEDLMGFSQGLDSVFGLHHVGHVHSAETTGSAVAGRRVSDVHAALADESSRRPAGLPGGTRSTSFSTRCASWTSGTGVATARRSPIASTWTTAPGGRTRSGGGPRTTGLPG